MMSQLMPVADVAPSSLPATVIFQKILRRSAQFWLVLAGLILFSFLVTLLAPSFLGSKKLTNQEQELRSVAWMIQGGASAIVGALFVLFGMTTLRGVVRGLVPYGVVLVLLAIGATIVQVLTIFLNVPLLSKNVDIFPVLVSVIVSGLVIALSLVLFMTGLVALRQNKAYKQWRTIRTNSKVLKNPILKPDTRSLEPSGRAKPSQETERDPAQLVKKTPFPKALRFSYGVWILIGVLMMISAVVNIGLTSSNLANQRQPTDDAMAAFAAACIQGLLSLAIGVVFIYVGQSTRTGKAKDVLGNGVGSVIFGVIQMVYFILLMPQALRLLSNDVHVGLGIASIVVASLSAIFGSLLFLAGMIALAQRQRYKAWRVSTGRSKKMRKPAGTSATPLPRQVDVSTPKKSSTGKKS